MKIIQRRFVSVFSLLSVIIAMTFLPSKSFAEMKMDFQVQKNPASNCDSIQKTIAILKSEMQANQCPVAQDRVKCSGLPSRSGGNDGHWEFDNKSCGDTDHRYDDGRSYNETCTRAGGTCTTTAD